MSLEGLVEVGKEKKAAAAPAEPTIEQFSPDYWEGFRRALYQGLTFGTADEIEAFVESKRTGRPYGEVIKEVRGDISTFRSEYPKTAFGAEIASSLVPGVGLTASLGRLGVGAVKSAVAGGGLYGYGAAEGDPLERLPGAATGAALGGVLQKAVPVASEAAKKIIKAGVPTTIGQTIGGAAKTLEEAATSLPFVGPTIAAAQRKAIEGFNVSTFNKVLEPIGAKVPKGLTGREAYDFTLKKLRSSYQGLVPKLEIPEKTNLINPLANTVGEVRKKLGESPKGQETYAVFEDLINQMVDEAFDPSGAVSGNSVQDLMIALRTASEDFVMEGGGIDARLSNIASSGFKQAADDVWEALASANQPNAEALRSINRGWALFIPAERAATSAGAKSGRFTPAQVVSAIRATEPGAKRAFGAGQARLQPFAETAEEVIGSRLPTSGSIERAATTALLTGGGYGVGGAPGALAPLALSAITSPLYSPTGQTAARKLLQYATPPVQAAVRRAPAAPGLLSEPVSDIGQMISSGIFGASPAEAGMLPGAGEARIPEPGIRYETRRDRFGRPITYAITGGGTGMTRVTP